jgi:formylglycine-generating enzyme required for sulfatase activity
MRLKLPARIGKYELQEFLGGGMSEVYRARDTIIGRTVAVKILTDEACADPEVRARFLLEAQMSGNLQHDHIVKIYDCGEDDNKRPYIVMEFLRGEDLAHAIKGKRAGDLRNRLRIALELAEALEYVHSCQIIHRDIKPENVHITTSGEVKLMDFGIAKAMGFSMTRAGFTLGTAYYMAPEQVEGKDITALVDVYSFGALMFELLTGARAISADTIERIFYCILKEPLDPKPLHEAGVPQPLSDLVERCVAKNPVDRPQSFGVIRREIEGMLKPEAAATPPPLVPRFKPRLAAGAAALAVLLLAGVALYYFHPWRNNAGDNASAGRGEKTVGKAANTGGKAEKRVELSPVLPTPAGEMVLVPAGTFLFGKEGQTVMLPAFYIDRTEVTNEAYQRFCEATRYSLPPGFPTDKPDYPVVNVAIEDARQFAKWAGKRLPTSQEWEKAARGAGGGKFPWGNEKDLTRANVRDNPMLVKHEVMPVTAFDNGASAFSARQMVGNVWEFIDEVGHPNQDTAAFYAKALKPPPQPQEPWYLMRGESYDEPLADEVMYDASTIPARWKDRRVGFRCVKDPPQ